MVFNQSTKDDVNKYIEIHVASLDWHLTFFNFISDNTLAERLGQEFISTRYIYKILEGLSVDDWMKRAQIRLQVLSYASIYEAVLHHILFKDLPSNPEVIALTEYKTKKQISIPNDKQSMIEKFLEHDGRKIIPTYESVGKTDESKVRFDKKAECAMKLGIINNLLKDELVELYNARNAIHIHAEIRKNFDYQIDLSKRAYRRMQPFKEQIIAWQGQQTLIIHDSLCHNPAEAST